MEISSQENLRKAFRIMFSHTLLFIEVFLTLLKQTAAIFQPSSGIEEAAIWSPCLRHMLEFLNHCLAYFFSILKNIITLSLSTQNTVKYKTKYIKSTILYQITSTKIIITLITIKVQSVQTTACWFTHPFVPLAFQMLAQSTAEAWFFSWTLETASPTWLVKVRPYIR